MLVMPTTRLRTSFLTAMAEFEETQGTADADGLSTVDLATGDVLARYVQDLNTGALPWQRTHEGSYVRVLWWTIEGEYIGRVLVRPDLTPGVVHANHIGFTVRPGRRRRGHATQMLAAALPVAFALGVDPVVLVCRETNFGSRTVIERNGGHLLAVLEDHRHYLIGPADVGGGSTAERAGTETS